MADASGAMADTTEWPHCRACGARYRPPQWGREYSCGTCGASLNGGAKLRRSISPLWILGMGAAVLAAGLVMRSLREGNAGAPPVPGQSLPAPVPAPVALPPHFEANLRQKLTLLEGDLARDPQNPGLMAAAALTSLSLAVATHQTSRDDPPIRKAEQWASALERNQRPSAAQIELLIRSAPTLEWSAPSGMSLAAALWPLRVGKTSLFSEPDPVNRGTLLTSGRFFAPLPNGFGAASRAGASARPRSMEHLPASRLPYFDEEEMRREVQRRRERFAANPQDRLAADQLGAELAAVAKVSEQAELMSDPKSHSHAAAYRKEATRVYETMGSSSRTRTERAAFLEAAAEMRRNANEWEVAYQLLKEAVQLAPFSPRIWKELQDAALQVGKLDEAEAARYHVREWSFPELKAPYGLPAEPTQRMPELRMPGPGGNAPG